AWALEVGPEPALTCGPRLAASIALEEGSLLALRQPELASQLLEYAGRKYALAKDPMGELLTAATRALLPPNMGAAQLTADLDAKIKQARTSLGLHAGFVADPHVLSKRDSIDPAASEIDFWRPWRFRFEIARLGDKAATLFSAANPPPPDLSHLAAMP